MPSHLHEEVLENWAQGSPLISVHKPRDRPQPHVSGVYPPPTWQKISCAINRYIAGMWSVGEDMPEDGSQFTTGTSENPALTIVTLAPRPADYIAQQMKADAI